MHNLIIFVRGLSPRVRGNRSIDGVNGIGLRSIPACAGEPTIANPLKIFYTVYPRVCGGTKLSVNCFCIPSGLSPRVRGNRL